jgi:hypothetical protein
MRRNDTRPTLVAILSDSAGVLDLTDATAVALHVEHVATGTQLVDAACTVSGASAGEVTYEWQAGDLDAAGMCYFEFQITYSDGTILTVPNSEDAQLRLLEERG